MKDAPSPPDPYCSFNDDDQRRRALQDRNRRDVQIVWARSCCLALSAIALGIGMPVGRDTAGNNSKIIPGCYDDKSPDAVRTPCLKRPVRA